MKAGTSTPWFIAKGDIVMAGLPGLDGIALEKDHIGYKVNRLEL